MKSNFIFICYLFILITFYILALIISDYKFNITSNYRFFLYELNNKEDVLNFDVLSKVQKLYFKNKSEENNWYIEIPRFNLKADIAEGTTPMVLNQFVGHFEDSALFDGNVSLAAHNRGYDVNYFANVKDLDYGDEIVYCYKNIKNNYVVDNICVIDETDWSNLEPTSENIVTLITCVEDMPNLRRCIQASVYSSGIN